MKTRELLISGKILVFGDKKINIRNTLNAIAGISAAALVISSSVSFGIKLKEYRDEMIRAIPSECSNENLTLKKNKFLEKKEMLSNGIISISDPIEQAKKIEILDAFEKGDVARQQFIQKCDSLKRKNKNHDLAI